MTEVAPPIDARHTPLSRHVIDASMEKVFAAWVTPAIVESWWGPDGFTTSVRELDFVEGGRFAFEMTAPDGSSCVMTGRYERIEPPSLLVFDIFDHCNLSLPDGVAPQQAPSRVTVRLFARGASTEVVVSHSSLSGTYEWLAAVSWSSALEKLQGRVTN